MELIGYCSNYREREGERDGMGWLKSHSKSELGINFKTPGSHHRFFTAVSQAQISGRVFLRFLTVVM